MEEIWKEFTRVGNNIYEASNRGRFWRIGKTKINYLSPYKRNCYKNNKNRRHTVIIKVINQEFNCNKLLVELFMRKLQPGEVVINKNNNRFDLNITNLFITTKKNLGAITGGKNSKAKRIIYFDNLGYKTSYPSARLLAKELGMCYQTILNIANKKTKKPKLKVEWEEEILNEKS